MGRPAKIRVRATVLIDETGRADDDIGFGTPAKVKEVE